MRIVHIFAEILMTLCVIENSLAQVATIDSFERPAYCGIYALCGGASSLGKDVDFSRLVSEEFVSSRSGSSILDLMNAAIELDVKLKPYSGLGIESLRQAQDPLILHVASPGQLSTYNHWLLFLGIEDGHAVIMDSKYGKRNVSLGKVCAIWDGIALAVHMDEHPNRRYGRIEVASALLTFVIAGLGIILGALLFKKFSSVLRPGFVFAASVSLLLFVSVLQGDCILWKSVASEYVTRVLNPKHFSAISYAELSELRKSSNSFVLMDARSRKQFQRGNIPGSINVPVETSSDATLEMITQDIPRRISIIVYCNYEACSFDDVLAARLSTLGFEDIKLYSGGYSDWIRQTKKNENSDESNLGPAN